MITEKKHWQLYNLLQYDSLSIAFALRSSYYRFNIFYLMVEIESFFFNFQSQPWITILSVQYPDLYLPRRQNYSHSPWDIYVLEQRNKQWQGKGVSNGASLTYKMAGKQACLYSGEKYRMF